MLVCGMDTSRLRPPRLKQGMRNAKGVLCAVPPKRIREIIQKIFASRAESEWINVEEAKSANVISSKEHAMLDAFAAKVGGSADCKPSRVYPCTTCLILERKLPHDGGYLCHYGHLACTACGVQCWYCKTLFSD